MQNLIETNDCYKYTLSKEVAINPSVTKGWSSKNVKSCDQETADCRTTKEFELKYVTEAELQAALKQVRRARLKKLDEDKWQHFLRWKYYSDAVVVDSSKDNDSQQNLKENNSSHLPEYVFSKPQNKCKKMSRVEEDDVQGSLVTATTLGGSVNELIGNTYQLGGVLTKRLQDLVATIGRMTSLLLSSVSSRTANYEDEDVDRTIKRTVEFDAMFARNHLYEIQRLLKDAKQLASGKAPMSELDAKVSAALKSVTQAIQVYAKHVSKGARVKYQQVVPIFQSISTIHSLLEQLTGQVGFPFRQELEVSCSYMKQLLLEMSTTDTQRVTVVSRKPARVKSSTGHKPSADLSMYNRRRSDWRRKTASLARSKFGPPSAKKLDEKPDIVPDKTDLNKNKADFSETNSQHHSISVTDKGSGQAKEVSHRQATRAVSEDNVATMVEMIPNEPIEDEDLCLDDSVFEVLKQLNGKHAPLRQENVVESQKSQVDCVPVSTQSVKEEPKNVQLICLREEDRPKLSLPVKKPEVLSNSEAIKDNHTLLTIDEVGKAEAEKYHQNMTKYHQMNPHYKDGKALDIVDRLATNILAEIVMDFQKEEINSVIQTLYKLEFQ